MENATNTSKNLNMGKFSISFIQEKRPSIDFSMFYRQTNFFT